VREHREVIIKEMRHRYVNEFPIFDYEDIQLVPNKCVIKSRVEADTSVTLGNHTFKFLWYNKNK